MKKITFFIAMLFATVGFSQDLLLGFESGESGGINGAPFGGGSYTVEAGTGANTSQVVKVVADSGGEVWQGSNFNLSENVDLTSTQTMSIDVKSATAITFLVKVNGGVNGAPEAAAEVVYPGGDTWQTINFTFNTSLDGKAAAASGVYQAFVIHAYWKTGETGFGGVTKDTRIFYVDNIKGTKAGAVSTPEPTDAPATPPSYDANNVVSLYSEAYTPAATISNVGWDDSAFEEMTIAGNKVLKVTGTNFLGMSLDSYVDATAMTHLHMDYWIAVDHQAGMVLNPKLSNHAAQAGETNGIDITNIINDQSEVKNWQSKDFALNGDRQSIKEFLITVAGKVGVYYLDNVYMYVQGTASIETNKLFNVSVYPNPSNNIVNLTANEVITKAEVFNVIGKKIRSFKVNSNATSINISDLNPGIYLLKYEINNKIGTTKFVKN